MTTTTDRGTIPPGHFATRRSAMRLSHHFVSIVVVLVSVPRPATGQEKNTAITGPADLERLAEIFAPPGTPSIRDKGCVAVETGPANAQSSVNGWLITETSTTLTLFDSEGNLHSLRKPKAGESRPKVKESKDGSIDFEAWHSADR